MLNFVKPGKVQTCTAPSGGVVSGTGVLIGTHLFGVATTTAAVSETFELLTEGTVQIAKTSALAISVGDALYWDATNKVVNRTATAQKCVGVAVLAAANPSSTVWLKLEPNPLAAGYAAG
jgi:predicted RecA/RadA family phage recombinase